MLEHATSIALGGSSSFCFSLMTTPRKAETGKLSAMRMPPTQRRTTTRSR
jgi:hypothetical protein